MAKISLAKVSSEELDRLLGVSKDTENDGDTADTEIVSATNTKQTLNDVSATNNSRGQTRKTTTMFCESVYRRALRLFYSKKPRSEMLVSLTWYYKLLRSISAKMLVALTPERLI